MDKTLYSSTNIIPFCIVQIKRIRKRHSWYKRPYPSFQHRVWSFYLPFSSNNSSNKPSRPPTKLCMILGENRERKLKVGVKHGSNTNRCPIGERDRERERERERE